MGTKRSIKDVVYDTEDNLSVPPGFTSLTSLTLKRTVAVRDAADHMAVAGQFKPGVIGASLSNSDIRMFKSSFVRRPWICHDQLDRVPQNHDSVQSEADTNGPVTARLPKGVIRGCANCHDCIKVTARWQPKGSCLPALDDAPVFRPTEEEFKDALKYIAKIRPRAENYGICRIVPPPSWKPPCLLEDKETWEASKFNTHVQKIDGLQSLFLKGKLSRLHEIKESQMLNVAADVETESLNERVADSEEAKSIGLTSEFEYGPEFTLRSFKKYADDFKLQYFCDNGNVNPNIRLTGVQDQGGPLIARIEGEYWRIIENPSEEIERYENHHLYSLSYLHLGNPKVWYGIPGRYCFKFMEVVKKLRPQLLNHPKLLHELVSQLPPSMLISEGIPVYRCVQNPSEFVIVFPGSYHSEFSCGFNCSEAVNFAPFDWLPHGQNIVELYAGYCLKTSLSHDKLLLGAAMEAVSVQWKSFATKKETLNSQLWRSVCGKDGILTRALKSRVKNEGIRRKHFCNLSRSRALDVLDDSTKRECSICLSDLYLSAVGCSCSPDRYSCLRHAKQLCSCAWVAKCFFFRYEITELTLLVEALEGNVKAIHSWARRKVQKIPDVISPRISSGSSYELNGIASNKNLLPASSGASEENRSTGDSGYASGGNVIPGNKDLMPASEISSGTNEEHRDVKCMFPPPDKNSRNTVHHSGRQNAVASSLVKNVVILLSDDED